MKSKSKVKARKSVSKLRTPQRKRSLPLTDFQMSPIELARTMFDIATNHGRDADYIMRPHHRRTRRPIEDIDPGIFAVWNRAGRDRRLELMGRR